MVIAITTSYNITISLYCCVHPFGLYFWVCKLNSTSNASQFCLVINVGSYCHWISVKMFNGYYGLLTARNDFFYVWQCQQHKHARAGTKIGSHVVAGTISQNCVVMHCYRKIQARATENIRTYVNFLVRHSLAFESSPTSTK